VLEVISRSAFDIRAVFDTVAESSVRLCEADRAFIFRFDGELLRMVVAFNEAPLEQLRIDDWDRMMDGNLKGVLYGIAAVLPHMQEQ
jgi:NAD(P)-dependent dehydrogenase (short-subunit alcohol dehydrogenase family)